MGDARRSTVGVSLSALVIGFAAAVAVGQTAQLELQQGESVPRVWHTATLAFSGGPMTSEDATPNPFTDYRLDVTFTHQGSGDSLVVPGYYAADGDAAQTSADSGDVWHARFMPDRVGVWSWSASFVEGADVALGGDGTPGDYDGLVGSFEVFETDKPAPDFRGRGLLLPDDGRYLVFAGDGTVFLKTGADSPENFLGYFGFDNTTDNGGQGNDLNDYPGELRGLHQYPTHEADWNPGDPTWGNLGGEPGRGKSIVGAVNYLASEGVNSIYFLTMNAYGDGREVYPWTAYPPNGGAGQDAAVRRFDVSKLAQWEVLFEHMTRNGVMLHVLTQETENDQFLDDGDMGPQRTLYYRELIARFAHHPVLKWNLGEENTNTTEQLKAFAAYFKSTDPYRHPIVVHTFPGQQDQVYDPLLGDPNLDGVSLQNGISAADNNARRWIADSAAAGNPWFACQDEIGPAQVGVTPDAGYPGFNGPDNHDAVRREVLWGNLMAGGAGVEWYFGYGNPHSDLDCEDFRSRDEWWDQNRHARSFFEALPVRDLVSSNGRSSLNDGDVEVLADPSPFGLIAVVFGDTSDTGTIDLGDRSQAMAGRWYNPRTGEFQGAPVLLDNADNTPVGSPPAEIGADWALLIDIGNPDDCDGNGLDDADEIAGNPSLDCNSNGLLDVCEGLADCDGDGTPDACQIADNPDLDCDGDGVLDSCDLGADCNENGVIDACDIAGGFSQDKNNNMVPDECEVFGPPGLRASFWNTGDQGQSPPFPEGPADLVRTDQAIDFDWGGGSPDPLIGGDGFASRWEGVVLTRDAGDYVFTVDTNDGVRLWINNALVIDEWRDQVARFSTTVTLPGNAPIPVRYEHYEGRNTAIARLLWTPPGGGQEVIGPGSLFLGIECAGDWDGNGVVNAADAGAFLSDYFLDFVNGTLVTDFDENGIVNAADVGAFLSAYFRDQTDPDCSGG